MKSPLKKFLDTLTDTGINSARIAAEAAKDYPKNDKKITWKLHKES